MSATVISEIEQRKLDERKRCRVDKLYLAQVLGYDFVSEVHKELLDQFFQYDTSRPWAEQSDVRKVLVLWSRGHYKTTAVIVDIIQCILNFPDCRILLMRGSIAVTKTLLHEVKSHFTGDNPNSRLRELFPEFCGDKLGNAMSFTVPARRNKGLASATVTVATPKSVKSGSHYDIGYFDDLVNDQNFRNEALLRKVKEDFYAMLPLLDPPFFAIVTGTRYAFGDTYEEIIRYNKGEWRVSLTTCWRDDAQTQPRFPQQPSPRDSGRLIGFTAEMLRLMQDADPEMFGAQFLNQPVQKGGKRFTEALLKGALVRPADVGRLSPAVFFIDLASTQEATSDDSCIIVGKHDINLKQYVVDARGGKWVPPQLANQIIALALEHKPSLMLFENTASCIYFVDFLRLVAADKRMNLPIDFIKVDQKKDAKYIRIASLEGFIRTKRLNFFEGLPAWAKIAHQFDIFPGGQHKHDDYIDTIALMTRYFGEKAILSPIRPITNPILEMIQNREAQEALSIISAPRKIDENEGYDAFA